MNTTYKLVMEDYSMRTVTCLTDPDRCTGYRVKNELQNYSEQLFGDRLRVRSFQVVRQNAVGVL